MAAPVDAIVGDEVELVVPDAAGRGQVAGHAHGEIPGCTAERPGSCGSRWMLVGDAPAGVVIAPSAASAAAIINANTDAAAT